MKNFKPIALVCSDLHLSDKKPTAVITEDWYECMYNMLEYIFNTSRRRKVPVVVAGDFFHKPQQSPKLESMVMSILMKSDFPCYVIAGQHDLLQRRLEQINETSLGVLIEANLVEFVRSACKQTEQTKIHFFSFGEENKKAQLGSKFNIGVFHHYVWMGKASYPGAPKELHAKRIAKKIDQGFDMMIFGDNHIPFEYKLKNGSTIINCGSTMKRSADQIDHTPRAYLIGTQEEEDKTKLVYEPCLIPTEKYLISREHIEEEKARDGRIKAFTEDLMAKSSGVSLGEEFEDTLLKVAKDTNVSDRTKNKIKEAIANVKGSD